MEGKETQTDGLKWVLIVEDEQDIAASLAEGLRRGGFKTIHAASVADATLKLMNQKFDCILLDMRLARGTGEHVISFVRSRGGLNTNTPVMVMSAFLDVDLIRRIRAQVQGVLVKPFNLLTLLSRMNSMLLAAAMEQPVADSAAAVGITENNDGSGDSGQGTPQA